MGISGITRTLKVVWSDGFAFCRLQQQCIRACCCNGTRIQQQYYSSKTHSSTQLEEMSLFPSFIIFVNLFGSFSLTR